LITKQVFLLVAFHIIFVDHDSLWSLFTFCFNDLAFI
jgi:hypothetical protein